MVELRGALPLLLAGSTGAALLGVGLTGLSGVEPQLARAADQVRHERLHDRRIVPDVPLAPAVPDVPATGTPANPGVPATTTPSVPATTAPDAPASATPGVPRQTVDCPDDLRPSASGKA